VRSRSFSSYPVPKQELGNEGAHCWLLTAGSLYKIFSPQPQVKVKKRRLFPGGRENSRSFSIQGAPTIESGGKLQPIQNIEPSEKFLNFFIDKLLEQNYHLACEENSKRR
jgi:hypothetical protein